MLKKTDKIKEELSCFCPNCELETTYKKSDFGKTVYFTSLEPLIMQAHCPNCPTVHIYPVYAQAPEYIQPSERKALFKEVNDHFKNKIPKKVEA